MVEAKGQASQVGGHGVVSQASGAALEPPSPVESEERFPDRVPLLAPCTDFLKFW